MARQLKEGKTVTRELKEEDGQSSVGEQGVF